MTSKRLMGLLLALFSVGAGVLRWLDLAGNTDAATGYLQQGGLALRYGLLAVPVVLALVLALCVPSKSCHRPKGVVAAPAFCGMLFSGIIGISLYVLRGGKVTELVAALLLLAGSLWFTGYVLKSEQTPGYLGLAAVAAWLLIAGVLFCTKTASIHHLLSIVELLGSLSALLLLSALLRATYSAGEKGVSRGLLFAGMTAFYFGFCLLLPQELWQWKHGVAIGFLQGKSVAAGLLGVTGLLCALCCLGEGEPVAEEEDESPETREAFARANRRLEQELAAEGPQDAPAANHADWLASLTATDEDIWAEQPSAGQDIEIVNEQPTDGQTADDASADDTAPAGDARPQARQTGGAPSGPAAMPDTQSPSWRSAAAALYGGAPVETGAEQNASRRQRRQSAAAAGQAVRRSAAASRTADGHETTGAPQENAAPAKTVRTQPPAPQTTAQQSAQTSRSQPSPAPQPTEVIQPPKAQKSQSAEAVVQPSKAQQPQQAEAGAQPPKTQQPQPAQTSQQPKAQNPQPVATSTMASETLDKLDDLLAQLSAPADRPAASAEDVLAELDLPTTRPSENDNGSDGEKWVFRRK